ncbi:hypothetical protein NVV95_02330 [Herbiconiux sp. CPCC 205716]|uniref:Uncharacterized protein n=1 Tax=Herbiconiux gentiana TaxID=2970912 RepID=A0ABT2GDM8_9MICO|nr:hypothetical protein [Herbiconiux gentiana]MCS5713385.1 hypothetical protein [Herbiconiux gentiana]
MSAGEVVHLVLIGRTLRGTLGEAFRAEAVALVGAGADARTALGRTVELTAVAVGEARAVRVAASIADPTFAGTGAVASAGAGAGADAGASAGAGAHGSGTAGTGAAPVTDGRHRFVVAVDEVPGIRPLTGPPGVDLARTVTVDVEAPVDARPRLAVHVVQRA